VCTELGTDEIRDLVEMLYPNLKKNAMRKLMLEVRKYCDGDGEVRTRPPLPSDRAP
jgi:hypothetical protein